MVRRMRFSALQRALLILALVLVPWLSADALVRDIRVGSHPNFTRLVIEWDGTIDLRKVRLDQRLVLHLEQPVDKDFDDARRRLQPFVRELSLSPDRKRIDIVANDGATPEARVLDDRLLVIDVPKPEAQSVTLRSGRHDGFDRLVLQPVKQDGYNARQFEDRLVIKLRDGVFGGDVPELSKRSTGISINRVQADALIARMPPGITPKTWFLAPDMVVVDFPVVAPTAEIAESSPTTATLDLDEPSVEVSTDVAEVAPEPEKKANVETADAPKAEPAPIDAPVAGKRAFEEVPPLVALAEAAPVNVDALPISAVETDDGPALQFKWTADVGAAGFVRGGKLWVVFDGTVGSIEPDTKAIRDVAGHLIRGLKQLSNDRATILLIEPAHALTPLMQRDRMTWNLHLKPSVKKLKELELSLTNGTALLIKDTVSEIRLDDPVIGDRIGVAMTRHARLGSRTPRHGVEINFLPSFQGAVWEEIGDRVVSYTTELGVLVGSDPELSLDMVGRELIADQGPLLPQENKLEEVVAGAVLPHRKIAAEAEQTVNDEQELDWSAIGHDDDPYLDLAAFGLAPGETLFDRRKALGPLLVSESAVERISGYLSLARHYLAQGFGGEPLLLLARADEIIEDAGAPLRAKRSVEALKGAAGLLLRRPEDGKKLDNPLFDNDPEITLWRAIAKADDEEWDAAQELMAASRDYLFDYPLPLQVRFGVRAARVGLESGRADPAFAIIDRLLRLPMTKQQELDVKSIEALALWRDGALEEARQAWQGVIAEASLRQRLATKLTLTMSEYDAGQISADHAAERLKSDQVLWRGHEQESDMFEQLGEFELAAGSPPEAIINWRTAIDRGAEPDHAAALAKRMKAVFGDYLSGELAQGASALQALRLYRRYSELLPPDEKGSAIVAALVAKLEEVGVYEPAIALLKRQQAQYDERSAEAAEIGAQIADLMQRTGQSTSALVALADSTPLDELEPELRSARAETAAQALASMGRYPEADARLSDDGSTTARQLRVELAAARNDWQQIIDILDNEEVLKGFDEAGTFVSQGDRSLMHLAIAHYHLGNRGRIGDLAIRYQPKLDEEHAKLLATFAGDDPLDGQVGKVVAELGERLSTWRDRLDVMQ